MNPQAEIIEIERRLRVARITVEGFLVVANIAPTTWYRWKSGQNKRPKAETLDKIRAALVRLKVEE